VLADGREHINSAKMSDFFDLAIVNSKSKSCKMMIHLEYCTPTTDESVYMSWVAIRNHGSFL